MHGGLSLPEVNKQDPTPRYLQAQQILVEAIRRGELAPGTKLPSTKEISGLFDISLITAHKALEGLVEAGWLRREVGRGTFVRDDVNPANGAHQQLAIGLLLDARFGVNLDDYYHSTILNALQRAARADSRRVEFFFHDRYDLRHKNRKQVGAVCIHPPLDAQEEVERLAQQHPVVVLGGQFPDAALPCVDCDNAQGGVLAVRHLAGLGHRRFLVVSGPIELSNARDRLSAALQTIGRSGLICRNDVAISSDSVVLDDAARVRIEEALARPDRPTAIFAGGFYLAMAVMQVVRRAGLTIPGDVSLVGFDDPVSAPLLDPPLTTVRQPLEEMAAAAYRLVHDGILGTPGRPQTRTLPPELIVRGSTGPAPANGR